MPAQSGFHIEVYTYSEEDPMKNEFEPVHGSGALLLLLPTAALAEEAGAAPDAANADSTYTTGEECRAGWRRG